jgi:AraC-like DNA-binding protein
MLAPPDDFAVKPFSDRMVPEANGFPVWNRMLSKWLIGAQGRPLKESPFQVSVRLRVLPDIRFGLGTIGPSVYQRTREVVAQDNDDLFFFMNLGGSFVATHAGREVGLAPGEAYVASCAERTSHAQPSGGKVLCLRTRRGAIQPLLRGLDDKLGGIIPGDTEALRMLSTYLRLNISEPLSSEALRHLATRHVHDLLALTLGASGEAKEEAQARGLHAARLKAAKALARRSLSDPHLTAESIAARLDISQRSLQRLFERDGTTFSDFVTGERLANAYAALGENRSRSIADIAMACGFGDLSHFNRKFRSRYRASPSEVRRGDMSAFIDEAWGKS